MGDRVDFTPTRSNDDEALIDYAKPIVTELRANMVRGDADFSATPKKWSTEHCSASCVGIWVWEGRITRSNAPRSGSSSGVVIPQCGTRALSVRLHQGGPQGAQPKAEVGADILASIKERGE